VELSQLTEQIAAWENGKSVEELSYDERKRVYTSLQQVHLPRMDDTGVVTFDDCQGTVESGPDTEKIHLYLDAVDGNSLPWSHLYLLLGLLNMAFLSIVAVGPFSVSGGTIAVFTLTTFLVAASMHFYYDRSQSQSDAPIAAD